MTTHSPSILCVEVDTAVLESRCALLSWAGYQVTYALPELAGALLWSRRFDLVVVSSAAPAILKRLVERAGQARVLILNESISPSELIDLVGRGLNQRRSA